MLCKGNIFIEKPEICFDLAGGSGAGNLSPSTVLPEAIFLVVGKSMEEGHSCTRSSHVNYIYKETNAPKDPPT